MKLYEKFHGKAGDFGVDLSTFIWSEFAVIISRAENMAQDDEFMKRFGQAAMPVVDEKKRESRRLRKNRIKEQATRRRPK